MAILEMKELLLRQKVNPVSLARGIFITNSFPLMGEVRACPVLDTGGE
jgi:hypothetical protein